MPELPTGAAPRLGLASDESIIDLVVSRYKGSANHHQAFYEKIKRYYDLFRGVTSTRHQDHRNNIHVPFALSVLESDVSRKVQALFGAWPPVIFAGYSKDDAGHAKRNTTLIAAQMRDARFFEKFTDFFTNADIYGTAFARVGWTTKVELERYREPNEVLGLEEIKTRDLITFDGPDLEVLDILDCFPQPNAKTIEDSAYFIFRYHLDLDELERRAMLGIYDMRGIRDLRANFGTDAQQQIISGREPLYRSMRDYEARQSERFAKPVEVIEYWGVVPNEFASDKIVNRVISVANGRILLRNRPFPFWIKDKPFFAYSPIRDPHYLFGIGKIEPIAKLNMTANKLASQKLDALEIFIDPVFLATADSGLDKQNLFMRAGRVFTADSISVGEDKVRALFPDLRGIQGSYTEIEQLWRWSQQATGIIEDTIMGGKGQSRETATSVQARLEGVANRLILEIMLAERTVVEPVADYMRALNRQFLKLPKLVRMLGSDAEVDPLSGFKLPQEPTEISHEDVNMDYRARATGATNLLSKAMRRQDVLALSGLVGQIPGAIQAINWVGYLNWVLDVFDAPAAQLLNEQPTALGMMAAQAGETGGISPTATPMLTPQMLSLGG